MTQRASAPSLVIVGVDHERVDLLTQACERAGWQRPRLVSYATAMEGIASYVDEQSVVRFESVDEDAEAVRCFLVAGARDVDGDGDAVESPMDTMTSAQAQDHVVAPGEIRAMGQIYRGQCSVWSSLEQRARACGASMMNTAASLGVAFDKRSTIACLRSAGVAVPLTLPQVSCFDELALQIMDVPGHQVMVKPAHGAGATGIVALRTDGRRWLAHTTALLDGSTLWNTRTVRVLNDENEIRLLVDALCRQVVHVEQWVPKASTAGGGFDLRVVVIGGSARHVLMRSAKGPFTNLHLGARRGDVEQLRVRLGESTWQKVLRSAEDAVNAVGGFLYAGVDVVVQSNWSSVVVLEVNGFGDWHPGVFVDAKDTYDWELMALNSRNVSAVAVQR